MIASIPAYAVSQADIDYVKAQRDSVANEKAAQQSIIDNFIVERDSIIDKKMALEENVALDLEQIRLLDEEISLYDAMIAEKLKEVEAAKAEEDLQMKRYRTRIRAMEENGTYSILALLLNADSYAGLLAAIDDMGDVMDADKKLYEQLQAARMAHEKIEAEYEAYKSELEEKQNQLIAEKQQLENEIAVAQGEIDEIQQQINENQDLLNEINERFNKLNEQVSSLENTYALQHAAPGSLVGSGFVWPCSTVLITSRAGNRIHPVTGVEKYHSGMDVGAGYGDSVWAAASGTVSLAGWYSGYGNCVIIQHDNGYNTLYGHLSYISVSKGQQVNSLETIGAVGSTGLATGPHLHFEIRSGETCLDPESFFPTGSFSFTADCGE